MSLLSRLFLNKKTKNATITLIGPSQAGKTTFIKYMETGEAVEKEFGTTLGIDVRKNSVIIDGWKLNVIDTGGQELYQQTFWELAIHQADAVIFVIDATVKKNDQPELYELARQQFSYALDIIPEGLPLLVLLNKQDLKELKPMTPNEAFDIFDLARFVNKTIAYIPVSAKYGQGIPQSLEWLVEHIN